MDDKQPKQPWKKPEIEEVVLESEADVLAACWSASQTARRPTCGYSRCAV